MEVFLSRTLEAIKSWRKNKEYRRLVDSEVELFHSVENPPGPPSPLRPVAEEAPNFESRHLPGELDSDVDPNSEPGKFRRNLIVEFNALIKSSWGGGLYSP